MKVEGTVATGFEKLRGAFADGQAKDEGGAQLCVYRHGRRVVDLWSAIDNADGSAFTARSITLLMSCTKAATAICAHILAERGLLDYDAPVSRYWPQFAAKGKAKITLRDVLSHRAGLMGIEEEAVITRADLFKWEPIVNALADMEPLWEPGTAYFYHFTTYGYLVGEVIRRVSGMSVGQFLAANVSRPLGIDLWIGLPEEAEHRVAPCIPSPQRVSDAQWRALFAGLGIDLNARLTRTVLHTFASIDAATPLIDTRECHAAELPASNGIGNARALAKMYAACIGEVDGKRLIGAETMERARECQTDGLSVPAPMVPLSGQGPQRFGLGFELPRAVEPMLGPGSFGHAGAGGRMAFAHPESGTAVGYVCTSMMWDGVKGPDDRWVPWTKALRETIGL